MNTDLLKKVATKLRRMRHKDHFQMESFAAKNECGTAACVFGHALIMSGYKPIFDIDWIDSTYQFRSPNGRRCDAFTIGCRVLGLTTKQGERLADADEWPDDFNGSDDYGGADSSVYNNPKIAAARIDHFIATKGKE